MRFPPNSLFIPFIFPSQLYLKPAVKKPFGIKCNIYKHIKVLLICHFQRKQTPFELASCGLIFSPGLWQPGHSASSPLEKASETTARQWSEPALCLALLAVVTAKGETGRVGTAASNCLGRPSGPGHIGVTTSTAEGNKTWSIRVRKTPRKS